MEKALRRQAGADVIRLDTQEAYAHYALREPQPIDFDAIKRAAYDAVYEITSIALTLNGEVVAGDCAQCGETVPMFELSGSGQRLEMAAGAAVGRRGLLRAEVRGWREGHPVLHPQAWDAEADVIPRAR